MSRPQQGRFENTVTVGDLRRSERGNTRAHSCRRRSEVRKLHFTCTWLEATVFPGSPETVLKHGGRFHWLAHCALGLGPRGGLVPGARCWWGALQPCICAAAFHLCPTPRHFLLLDIQPALHARVSPLRPSHAPDGRSAVICIWPEHVWLWNDTVITFSAHGPTLMSSQDWSWPWTEHCPGRMVAELLQLPQPSVQLELKVSCVELSHEKLYTRGSYSGPAALHMSHGYSWTTPCS